MRSVLKQSPLRGLQFRLKQPRFSTSAALILALMIGVTSVIFVGFYTAFGPMRYPKRVAAAMSSTLTGDSEEASPALKFSEFRSTPSLHSLSDHRSSEAKKPEDRPASRSAAQHSRDRRRARGVVCTLARAGRARMQRAQSRTARCVQTGVGDLEHPPNSFGNEISIGSKSC